MIKAVASATQYFPHVMHARPVAWRPRRTIAQLQPRPSTDRNPQQRRRLVVSAHALFLMMKSLPSWTS
jgi:hypothetical protein